MREPEARVVVYEIEHHLLVVAPNNYDTLGARALQLKHVRDDAGRVRPAINQVAEENKRVGILVMRKYVQERIELCAASVNISDHKSFHSLSASLRGVRAVDPLHQFLPAGVFV